jgi:signal transduction histidine kinase
MRKAAEQMDALIQDLLDVTRIEYGRLQLAPQTVSIESVLSYPLDTLAPIAADKGVTLRMDVASAMPPLFVDPDRIVQVLANLVSNAINHTPASGSVTVSASRDHDDVRITVADTGSGIPAEDLPRVFDRFWQSRRTNRSGAGLGLTIARGIVRGHGGRIWIESDLGKGTRVHFTVPAAAEQAPSNAGRVTHQPDASTTPR